MPFPLPPSPTYQPSPELMTAMEQLAKVRPSPEIWLRKKTAVSKWIGSFDLKSSIHRVLCKGEWRGEEQHLPAVLIYNEQTKKVLVWCPEGASDVMVVKDIHHFHSTVPHVAVAKEIYADSDKGSTL